MLKTVHYQPANPGSHHESDAEASLYAKFEKLGNFCNYQNLPKEEKSLFWRKCIKGGDSFTEDMLEEGAEDLRRYLDQLVLDVKAEKARSGMDTWRRYCDTKLDQIAHFQEELAHWLANAREAMNLAIPASEEVDPFFVDKMEARA